MVESHVCRRCGYRGEGVSYFSKGSHIAGLVVLGLISSAFMGAFALFYYFSYHDHRICPRCGKDWGKRPARDEVRSLGSGERQTAVALPKSGRGSQMLSVALFVFAALMLVIGITEGELAPILISSLPATGAFFLHKSAVRSREARRQALLSNLQLPVLKLASERQGRLTVTEVAASLGWTLPRAEKVLESLEDGLRVCSDVTDEGVIVYEFRELALSRPRLSDHHG